MLIVLFSATLDFFYRGGLSSLGVDTVVGTCCSVGNGSVGEQTPMLLFVPHTLGRDETGLRSGSGGP